MVYTGGCPVGYSHNVKEEIRSHFHKAVSGPTQGLVYSHTTPSPGGVPKSLKLQGRVVKNLKGRVFFTFWVKNVRK